MAEAEGEVKHEGKFWVDEKEMECVVNWENESEIVGVVEWKLE